MRKLYGLGAAAIMLAVLMLLGGVTPVRSQSFPTIRMYPTLSLRNFHVPPLTGPGNGVQRVPLPGAGGERYFLIPVWIYNEVDTSFNNQGIVPPGNNNGQYFGQHLEPIRSFHFQVWYQQQAEILDTGHGSPIVMTGPSIVGGGIDAATISHPDTGLAKTFFVTFTDQSANDPNNPYTHVIRIAGASSVPLPNNMSGDSGYSEHNGILFWLRFRVLPGGFPGDELHLDSSMFNDHIGDSLINPATNPFRFDYTHGNFGGGTGVLGGTNTGHLEIKITDQPAFILRPLNLIAQTDGPDGPNDSLLPDMVYDPAGTGGAVTTELQLSDDISFTEIDNTTISSDQSWLDVGIGAPGNSTSVFLGYDALDYTSGFGATVDNLYLSVANPGSLAPGVYYATVTFTSAGAVNSPFKLHLRFVRLASPNEPNLGGTGIRLMLSNSCAPVCTNTITFGTGAGATDGIDVLYGEQVVTAEDLLGADTNGQCIAYFVPLDTAADTAFSNPDFVGMTRDIRSANTDTTILYEVSFNPGNVNCYPEKVCVNPVDFPAGARIVLKFTLNGTEQGIDLRNATVDQNGNECVTITDHRINHFYIEYTPATIANLGTFLKHNSWSFISLPVVPPNPDAGVIFPNAVGAPFWYNSQSAWQNPPANQLEFGRGYMVRYGDYIGSDITVAGVKSYSVGPVSLSQGWNTIGGTSGPGTWDGSNGTVIIFTPNPGGPVPIAQNQGLWEFTPQTGYDQTNFFTPGRGYFIKVDHSGFFNMTTTPPPSTAKQNYTPSGIVAARENLQGQLTQVLVRDANQNGQDLYFGHATSTIPESQFEMPTNFRSFDARFDGNSGMMSYNHTAYTVDLHASSYPLTMTFTNLAGSATVTDMNGTVLGTVTNNGIVTIADPTVTKVHITESAAGVGQSSVTGYSLEANQPNPFPQTSTIRYTLPQESVVSLVVYNQLGQVVQTLVSGTVPAGDHEALFDGRSLPSGTYYYTLKAGNFVQTQSMSLAR